MNKIKFSVIDQFFKRLFCQHPGGFLYKDCKNFKVRRECKACGKIKKEKSEFARK